MENRVFVEQIETAVPAHQMHQKFVDFIPQLLSDKRQLSLFKRLEKKSGISKRYSVLAPDKSPQILDDEGFYKLGAFPSTAERMKKYEDEAFHLMSQCLEPVFKKHDPKSFTHLIVSSCTGFYAPGPDLDLIFKLGLSSSVERSLIGFMGCYAGINSYKAAYHIVRSQPESKVLVLNLELCSLHLQESREVEDLLSFLLFADGCAASVVSGESSPLEINSFHCDVLAEDKELITWRVADSGFLMHLDTKVPQALKQGIHHLGDRFKERVQLQNKSLFAIHPGGRAILDAVQTGLEIAEEDMSYSRYVLDNFGNMSSPSVVFVMKEIMKDIKTDGSGIALAFGPGLTVETMSFTKSAL